MTINDIAPQPDFKTLARLIRKPAGGLFSEG
jgi:hypothetical protein